MTFASDNSVTYTYDASFDGFLTVVFRAIADKTEPLQIIAVDNKRLEGRDFAVVESKCTTVRRGVQLPLGDVVQVSTVKNEASRVWTALEKKTGPKYARLVNIAFLAQETDTEMLLWRYLKKVFLSKDPNAYRNMLDPDMFELVQLARKVGHEVHRFHGFVRFQETVDGMYFAPVDPDHDIVRLLARHFKSRFASQKWIIYDTKRNYGIFFDTVDVKEIVLNNPAFDLTTGNLHDHVKDLDQEYYKSLWQAYYDAINIIERKNHRQMKRAMPKRYWKYLPEKDSQT